MLAAREQVDGLPEGFRFHDLRHYFASMLIASGLDVKVVQTRLRHASARTTARRLRPPHARLGRHLTGSRLGRARAACGFRLARTLSWKHRGPDQRLCWSGPLSDQMSKYSSNSCGCGRRRIGVISLARL
ncbi:tyrosine-type recombinase/integrase [Serinicoccus marinus]|uniref:tyrosine-type recombinase/integrase n=1 Tax=Serinicoccus marinus TaxID=247333 RepID=UPI00307B6CA7